MLRPGRTNTPNHGKPNGFPFFMLRSHASIAALPIERFWHSQIIVAPTLTLLRAMYSILTFPLPLSRRCICFLATRRELNAIPPSAFRLPPSAFLCLPSSCQHRNACTTAPPISWQRSLVCQRITFQQAIRIDASFPSF